jgi:hypothetical protein
VNLYVQLRPFTDFKAAILGVQLSEIVRKPVNDRLVIDFPAIRKLYGETEQAKRTVAKRQAEMAANRKFAALAVVLGKNEATARVCGVTTMLVRRLPGLNLAFGTHTAMWLDVERESFRSVGTSLLALRLEWLLARPAFTGPVWTVIRVGNRASCEAWERNRSIYPMALQAVGRPCTYQRLDGVRRPRQLYRSLLTLEQARAKGGR